MLSRCICFLFKHAFGLVRGKYEQIKKDFRKVLCTSHVHKYFRNKYKLLLTGYNLNLSLKLILYLHIIFNNNLLFKIFFCKNITDNHNISQDINNICPNPINKK